MGELFRRHRPAVALPWTGERLVSDISGAIENEHLHRYFLARELCRGKRVVDVASGEGYGTALLAQTASDVTGIEIDQQSVIHASCAYRSPNLHYIQGEACHLPLKNASVDVVVSFETLEHFGDHENFLAEAGRVLTPNGLLVISTPDSDVYSAAGNAPNPFHIKELTKPEFDRALRSAFQNLLILQQRVFAGSVMVPDTIIADKTLFFEQRSAETFEGYRYLPQAPYLVALASNATVPLINTTMYIENAELTAENPETQAELDRLRQVEAVVQRVHDEAAVVQAESTRLISANSSLEAELDRLRQAEANAREQIASLTQALSDAEAQKKEIAHTNLTLKKALEKARENTEVISGQLDRSQVLTRQQALVIQRIQNELMLQSQSCQSWQNEALLMKAEALKYSQTLNDVSRLVIPVPIRKLFPNFMRRPVQVLKQKMQAQTQRVS